MLTPKQNKPRDPAKSLLFPGVPEVEETRELVTMLGRQDRPIIVGPWLTETGFELLYWIPFLAWAKAYASLHDDQLIVVSRGGAAPWYRHITSQLPRHPVALRRRRVPPAQRGAHPRAAGAASSTSTSASSTRRSSSA